MHFAFIYTRVLNVLFWFKITKSKNLNMCQQSRILPVCICNLNLFMMLLLHSGKKSANLLQRQDGRGHAEMEVKHHHSVLLSQRRQPLPQ